MQIFLRGGGRNFLLRVMHVYVFGESSRIIQGRFYEVVRHSVGDPTFVPKMLKLPVTAAHLRSAVRIRCSVPILSLHLINRWLSV